MNKYSLNSRKSEAEYFTWINMRARCNNNKNPAYKNYGGRGIKVCEEWSSYERFIKDMGRKPSRELTLERENNNLGYSKDNCKWATRSEQANNTRKVLFYLIDGKSMNRSMIYKYLLVSKSSFYNFLDGDLSSEKVSKAVTYFKSLHLTTPRRKWSPKLKKNSNIKSS